MPAPPAPVSSQTGGSLLFSSRRTPAGNEHRNHKNWRIGAIGLEELGYLAAPVPVAALRYRGPLADVLRSGSEKAPQNQRCCGVAAPPGERTSGRSGATFGRACDQPADVRLPCGRASVSATELVSHSSGIPALRRPAKNVVS